MKSLNTSLPKQPHPPSEQLLQAFKSAALSVTNLYKTAAADQAQAHAEGYQEALEDLLDFLDKENLGLCDGEGWRVREWMTEKLQGYQPQHTSETEEDPDDDKRARSLSPELARKNTAEASPAAHHILLSSPPRPESAPVPAKENNRPKASENIYPPQGDFLFRSTLSYPPSSDMEMSPTEVNLTRNGPLRLDLPSVSKPTRLRHNSRTSSRPNAATGTLGMGAGSKRRMPVPDLFDLGGFGSGRDYTGGGGKRGKYA